MSYRWTQLSGTPVSLAGANNATPSFTAPAVGTATDLEFELRTVDDTDLDAFDTVRITVNP